MHAGDTSIADIVRAAHDGDPGAIEALVQRLRPALLPAARVILRDAEAAEDAFIEAITRVVQRLNEVHPEAAFVYARRAVRRAAIDQLRSRQGRDARLALRGTDSLRNREPSRSTEPVERLADSATSPERRAIRDDARQRIFAAIDALSEPERSVIRLHLVDGRTLDECAADLDTSRTSVKRHLRSGRASLARRLRDLHEPGAPHGL